jgi:hypothetical protein
MIVVGQKLHTLMKSSSLRFRMKFFPVVECGVENLMAMAELLTFDGTLHCNFSSFRKVLLRCYYYYYYYYLPPLKQ